jgi:hypothetical protein
LRVIGRDGARADDHRIGQRAHPVQVQDVFVTSYELRLARMRRDEAVEALAQMTDRDRLDRGPAAKRQIQIHERVAGIVGRQERRPARAGMPGDDRIGMSCGLRPQLRILAQ